MFLVNDAMIDISIGTAGLVALLGYLVVFTGLVLLMFVIKIEGGIMIGKTKKAAKAVPAAEPEQAPLMPIAAAKAAPAPGSAGELKLHDVPDREAAILMAIVANKMGKPLNELRFKSIKEVK